VVKIIFFSALLLFGANEDLLGLPLAAEHRKKIQKSIEKLI